MTGILTFTVFLASGWSFTGAELDRVRWNARERTAAGIEELGGEEPKSAIEAFETAARLDPEDPRLRFNAGSAHLLAGGEGAIDHLRSAAAGATGELAAQANYNLGNALLATGDPAAAIEAYENTLRQAPEHDEARFNLEVALEQLEQQQQQQQQQGDEGEENQDQQQQPNQEPPPQDNQEENEEQEQQQPSDQQQPQEEGQGEQPQQLPQFEDQPDMTAEQAAAILEAVENLEREQRRKQAEEQAKKRPQKGKDW